MAELDEFSAQAKVEEQNVVRMRSDTRSYYFPLDRILSVYEDPEGWHVVKDVYRYEYGQGR